MNILTEEELKERNRLLVLENDELNAQVMRFKQALEHICEVEMDSAEFEKEVMFNIARDILKEEFK